MGYIVASERCEGQVKAGLEDFRGWKFLTREIVQASLQKAGAEAR